MLAFFLAEIESISSLEACRQRLDSMTSGLPGLCLCVDGSEKRPGSRGHWGPRLAWP